MPYALLKHAAASVGQAGRQRYRSIHPQENNPPAVPGDVRGARGNQNHQQTDCLNIAPGITKYDVMFFHLVTHFY